MLLAAVGLVRLPDLFTRLHATTKAGTVGAWFMMLAVIYFFSEVVVVMRAVAILLFLALTAPVSAHMIGQAAYSRGWSSGSTAPQAAVCRRRLRSRMSTAPDDAVADHHPWTSCSPSSFRSPLPWLHRPGRTATEWLLALVPLTVAIYLASKRLGGSAVEPLRAMVPWVPALDVDLAFYSTG